MVAAYHSIYNEQSQTGKIDLESKKHKKHKSPLAMQQKSCYNCPTNVIIKKGY